MQKPIKEQNVMKDNISFEMHQLINSIQTINMQIQNFSTVFSNATNNLVKSVQNMEKLFKNMSHNYDQEQKCGKQNSQMYEKNDREKVYLKKNKVSSESRLFSREEYQSQSLKQTKYKIILSHKGHAGENLQKNQTQRQKLSIKETQFPNTINLDRRFNNISFDNYNIQQKYGQIFHNNHKFKQNCFTPKNNTITKITQPLLVHLTDMTTRIFQASFNLFYQNNMDFNRVKIYCSENIITNLTQIFRYQKLDRKQIQSIDKHLTQEIMPYIQYQYPHSQQKNTSTKLLNLIHKINTYEQIQNDVVFQSNTIFKLREDNDYSKQILEVIETILKIPDRKFCMETNQTLYEAFQAYISKVFEKAMDDQWINQSLDQNINYLSQNQQKLIKKTIEENVHQEHNHADDNADNNKNAAKIQQNKSNIQIKDEQPIGQKSRRQYSQLLIGRKISQGISYSKQKQLVQKGIKMLQISDSALARIIAKWCQQLEQRYFQTDKFIMNRSGTFWCDFGNGIDSHAYFPLNAKQKLVQLLKQQKSNFQIQKSKLLNNLYKFLGQTIDRNLQKYFITKSPVKQATVGTLVAALTKAKQNYLLKYLNLLIHSILKVQDRFQQTKIWVKPHLINFTLGDLARCKIISKQNQITALYKHLIKQSHDGTVLKVLRVKNRLNKVTKDLLINVRFGEKQKMVAEIQLAIKSQMNEYLKKSDSFSHYLYEIIRGRLGGFIQFCGVWAKYDQRYKYYEKQFKTKNLKREFKGIKMSKKHPNNFQYIQKYPFWCDSCDKMQTALKYSLHNYYCRQNQQCNEPHQQNFSICGQCMLENKQYLNSVVNRTKQLKEKQLIEQIPKNQYFYAVRKSDNKYYPLRLFVSSLQIQKKKLVFQKIDNKYREFYDISTKKKLSQFLCEFIIFVSSCNPEYFQVQKMQKFIRAEYQIPQIFTSIIDQQLKFIHLQNISFFQKQQFNLILEQFSGRFTNVTSVRLQNTGFSDIGCLHKAIPYLQQLIIKDKTVKLKNMQSLSRYRQTMTTKLCIETIYPEIHPSILMLDNLKYLVLNSCQIQIIPGDIKKMKRLQQIQLRNNKIKQIPSEFCELLSLNKLYIDGNKLTKLPNNISRLSKLQLLSVISNQLTELPSSLYQLPVLNNLQINYNSLQKLDFRLFQMKSIDIVFYQFNKLTKLQNYSKSDRISISNIVLSNNQMQIIPLPELYQDQNINISKYASLNGLYCNNNNILTLPNQINLLKNIRQIELSFNKIKDIPQSLCQLFNLTELLLSGNYLTNLPTNFSKLTSLKILYLQLNNFKQIPCSIYALQNLMQLRFNHNRIGNISPNIKNLQKVCKLNLSYNLIKSIPAELKSLSNLEYLLINGNNLQKPILSQNWKKLQMNYLAADIDAFQIDPQTNKIQFPQSIKNRVFIKNDKISIKTKKSEGKHYCGRSFYVQNKLQEIGSNINYEFAKNQQILKICGLQSGLNCQDCMNIDLEQYGIETPSRLLINSGGKICEIRQNNKFICVDLERLQKFYKIKKYQKYISNFFICCSQQNVCEYCQEISKMYNQQNLYKKLIIQ